MKCDPRTGTGVPPASVAEWTLSAGGDVDWYDGTHICYLSLRMYFDGFGGLVSLVDGYNLPMRISNNVGCPVAECAVDLGPNCPAPLKGPFDASGFPLGCKASSFFLHE